MYTTNRNGSRTAITEYFRYARTAGLGEITVDEWYSLMAQAVEAEGKQELLNRIKDHCKKLAWLRDDKEITEYAMKCLSSGVYRAWRRNKRLTPKQMQKLKKRMEAKRDGKGNEKAGRGDRLGTG
jgi:hypothetical protein